MPRLSLVELVLESKGAQHADQCSESLMLLDQNHKVQGTPLDSNTSSINDRRGILTHDFYELIFSGLQMWMEGRVTTS